MATCQAICPHLWLSPPQCSHSSAPCRGQGCGVTAPVSSHPWGTEPTCILLTWGVGGPESLPSAFQERRWRNTYHDKSPYLSHCLLSVTLWGEGLSLPLPRGGLRVGRALQPPALKHSDSCLLPRQLRCPGHRGSAVDGGGDCSLVPGHKASELSRMGWGALSPGLARYRCTSAESPAPQAVVKVALRP